MDNYNSEDDEDDDDEDDDDDGEDDDDDDDDDDEGDSGNGLDQNQYRSEVNFSDMQSYGNGQNGMYTGQAQGFGSQI